MIGKTRSATEKVPDNAPECCPGTGMTFIMIILRMINLLQNAKMYAGVRPAHYPSFRPTAPKSSVAEPVQQQYDVRTLCDTFSPSRD